MFKILIADDHEIMRHGIEQILLEEFPLAYMEEAENGQILVEKVKAADWDLIITDISMPIMSGLEAVIEIKKHKPTIPILVLSMHSEEHYCISAFKVGAAGYLSKAMAQNELLNAIKKILSGRKYIPESLILKKVKFLQTKNPL
jgi:two-component system, NarL family, invasion response regulator UvrY